MGSRGFSTYIENIRPIREGLKNVARIRKVRAEQLPEVIPAGFDLINVCPLPPTFVHYFRLIRKCVDGDDFVNIYSCRRCRNSFVERISFHVNAKGESKPVKSFDYIEWLKPAEYQSLPLKKGSAKKEENTSISGSESHDSYKESDNQQFVLNRNKP